MTGSVTFVGHRLFDSISFAANTEVCALLCCDGGGSVQKAREEFGLELYALEAVAPTRQNWTSDYTDAMVTRLWPLLSPPVKNTDFIGYTSSVFMEAKAARGEVKQWHANRDKLKTFFDNKLVSRRVFKTLTLPRMASHVMLFSQEAVNCAAMKTPLIVRRPISLAGNGVFRVGRGEEPYRCLLAQGMKDGETVMLEPFLEGTPININAAITGDAIHIYPPSIQLIGLPDYTSLPFGFCGNDFVRAQRLPPEVIEESLRQARRVGEYLRLGGFKGVFGLDQLVTKQGAVMPCEINPRFQSSTALLNWSHKTLANSPALLQLAAFRAEKVKAQRSEIATPYSQIILHALAHEADATITGELTEGRYHMDEAGDVRLIEHTLDLSRLEGDEIFVIGAPCVKGVKLAGGASLFTAVVKDSVTENGFEIASPRIKNALAILKGRLRIQRKEDAK